MIFGGVLTAFRVPAHPASFIVYGADGVFLSKQPGGLPSRLLDELFRALSEAFRQSGQKALPVQVGHGGDRLFRQLMDQLAAIVQAQQVHISDLALVLVGADGLAEFVGVSDDVQHIVPDLEGQTQLIAVGFCCLPGHLAAAGCADAQHTGSGDHGAGFQVVDLR